MTYPNVSRETSDSLEDFAEELLRWTAKINLIGRSTTADIAERHIADSIQVVNAAPVDIAKWVDLGSGGGLPVVVAAILRKQEKTQFVAVESDQRKATFLRHMATRQDLKLKVLAERIETAPQQAADVVSARALAPLHTLLGFARHHGKPDSLCLFPKGNSFQEEIDRARMDFRFDVEILPSKISAGSVVLKIKDIQDV